VWKRGGYEERIGKDRKEKERKKTDVPLQVGTILV
jgi:hypothetical protein